MTGALLGLLGNVAGPALELLKRDPEAQRIATRHRAHRLGFKAWWRQLDQAVRMFRRAKTDRQQRAAVLRLLALGITEDMLRRASRIAKEIPDEPKPQRRRPARPRRKREGLVVPEAGD